jgi:hypothetical protein
LVPAEWDFQELEANPLDANTYPTEIGVIPPMPMTEAQLDARDAAILAKPDPETIWLQPRCEIEERSWCEDHPGDCTDHGCGLKAVKYVRADLVLKMKD